MRQSQFVQISPTRRFIPCSLHKSILGALIRKNHAGAFFVMGTETRDASTPTEERSARPIRDYDAFIVKCVFMGTLVAAVGGWLWLLGKGAVAVARAMSSL
jgi:fatty acid desaturase